MLESEPVKKIMDRISVKLDLMSELVDARKEHDWKKVDLVCKKLDNLKK